MSSSLKRCVLRGRTLFLKHDDAVCLCDAMGANKSQCRGADAQWCAFLRGNKARKLVGIANALSSPQVTAVASHGGIQSNSMAALSAIVARENAHRRTLQSKPSQVEFTYFTRTRVPSWLKQSPTGNYGEALRNGAKVVELDNANYDVVTSAPCRHDGLQVSTFRRLVDGSGGAQKSETPAPSNILWVPMGGAMPEAAPGVFSMVDELVEQLCDSAMSSSSGPSRWVLAMASGTGCAALFAHTGIEHRKQDLKKVTLSWFCYVRRHMAQR